MPSTTALFTGLSGLSTNSRRLDVIGNNIANINTAAYKSNRMLFSPLFSKNLSLGTAPRDSTGGSNPVQIGYGAQIAGTQRNFSTGSITSTGVSTDVAIEGDGHFIVEFSGERLYTRHGSFQQNASNDLVTISGGKVMGYSVDDQFNVIEGALAPINIPVGTLTVAEATRNVVLSGNLNASGNPSTSGSTHETRTFFQEAGLATPIDGTEDLTLPASDLYIDNGQGGSFLALDGGEGAVITINGVEKAGKDLGTHTFAFSTTAVPDVDAFGATMNDFVSFLEGVLGLHDDPINGQDLGGSISIVGGQIQITGNEGTVQDLDVETADIVVSYPSTYTGNGINQPFVMTKTGAADGESVRTSFVVYDSLGTPMTIDLSMVLQETIDGAGTMWEFIAESSDNDDSSRILGLGTIEFDENGQFVNSSNQSFSIVRGNGAVSPLTVAMEFADPTQNITSLTDTASNLAAVFQDGSPIGTLASFSIGQDGIITGAFTNGLSRSLGQVALAKFANNGGLVDVGNAYFKIGPNSGLPLETRPLDFGTGRLIGGALELSNVDLSQEFINMILASTGYSASSRVISTTNDLIDQLLLLAR